MVKGRSKFAGAGRLAAGILVLVGVATFAAPVNEAQAQFSFGIGGGGFGRQRMMVPNRSPMVRPNVMRPNMMRPNVMRPGMVRTPNMVRTPGMVTRVPGRHPPVVTRVPGRYPPVVNRIPGRYPPVAGRPPVRVPPVTGRPPVRYPPVAGRPTNPTIPCVGRRCTPPPVVGCRGRNCGEYPPRIPGRPPHRPPVIVVPQPPVIVPPPVVITRPVAPVVVPGGPLRPRPPVATALLPSLPPPRWTPPPALPRLAPVVVPAANENRFVRNEVLVVFRGRQTPAAIQAFARTNRLTLVSSETFRLSDSTLHQFRIDGTGRDVRSVLRTISRDQRVARAQPNFLFDLVLDQRSPAGEALHAPVSVPPKPSNAAPAVVAPSAVPPPPPPGSGAPPPPPAAALPGAPALASTPGGAPPPPPPQNDSLRELQYTLERLRVADAHRMVRGERVIIAVIDSGVDAEHPELAGAVRRVLDTTGGRGAAHCHGTAMVGAIAAQARLAGIAPAAEIVAIRAFDTPETCGGGRTSSMMLQRALDQAEASGARVVNMSFAGPRDAELSRALARARELGMVLIAASGNNGARAAPQFPAADPNVIAVIATDAEDRLFQDAVRGPHVAVAAPGVDVIVPAPGGNYDTSTGTSVAAAHVSGVAALLLQRNDLLDGETVRRVLTATARALTGVGPDAGAGLVDALAAINAVPPGAAQRPSAALR